MRHQLGMAYIPLPMGKNKSGYERKAELATASFSCPATYKQKQQVCATQQDTEHNNQWLNHRPTSTELVVYCDVVPNIAHKSYCSGATLRQKGVDIHSGLVQPPEDGDVKVPPGAQDLVARRFDGTSVSLWGSWQRHSVKTAQTQGK